MSAHDESQSAPAAPALRNDPDAANPEILVLLIAHDGDDSPAVALARNRAELLEQVKVAVWGEPHPDDTTNDAGDDMAEGMTDTLLETGVMTFEGDPPLRLVRIPVEWTECLACMDASRCRQSGLCDFPPNVIPALKAAELVLFDVANAEHICSLCGAKGWHSCGVASDENARTALSSPAPMSKSAEQRLLDALRWALGSGGEFPARGAGQGAYWWRTELMRRAGLHWDGEQFQLDVHLAPSVDEVRKGVAK